ncbi:glycosyltransferase [Bacteriovoracales bacterium]|nr:glycosyltransferase [Bacteriovoracales bacterium]
MISGDSAAIKGKKGPFYYTLSGLSKYWKKIDVLCCGSSSPSFKLNKNTTLYPTTNRSPLFPFFLIGKMVKKLKKNDYDLIVSHDYGLMLNGIITSILSRIFNIPYISEIHHIEGYPRISSIKDVVYRVTAPLYLKFFAKKAKRIRVINKNEVYTYLNSINFPMRKVSNITSMYIDLKTFNPTSKEKKFDIVFCGRFVSNKGIFQILELTKILKKERPKIKTLLIGQGPLEKSISKFIGKHSLEQNVKIVNWIESIQSLADYYKESQLLICSSTAEGGPRVTLEAMACGTPVISTPVGIMPEVIEHGKNGFLYNWDIKSLFLFSKKILDMNACEKEKMSKSAIKAIEKFNYPNTIKNYAKSYEDLILKHNFKEHRTY